MQHTGTQLTRVDCNGAMQHTETQTSGLIVMPLVKGITLADMLCHRPGLWPIQKERQDIYRVYTEAWSIRI